MKRIVMDAVIAAVLAMCYAIGFINAVRRGLTR